MYTVRVVLGAGLLRPIWLALGPINSTTHGLLSRMVTTIPFVLLLLFVAALDVHLDAALRPRTPRADLAEVFA